MMPREWMPLMGTFNTEGDRLIFAGGEFPNLTDPASGSLPARGLALTTDKSASGTISASMSFSKVGNDVNCSLLLYHDPITGFLVTAGLSGPGMFTVWQNDGQRWTVLKTAGDISNLLPNKQYKITVTVAGSRLSMEANGITVLAVDLPYSLPQSQVGVFCAARGTITISEYQVRSELPKVFVVMQFSSPYDELYSGVIKSVCAEFGLQVIRADEEYGPGVIIVDLARQIAEAQIIIAEITPANPNVYYEVGYAHALGKETILLADKSLKLPFDVSPFRTLLYENSIDGKGKLESGLRKHLQAIMQTGHLSDSVG
jgi:hypothetical protein